MPKDVHGDLAAWHLGGCSWWRLLIEKIWFYFLFLHIFFSFHSKATVVAVSCQLIIGIGVCRLEEAAWRGESRKGEGTLHLGDLRHHMAMWLQTLGPT